MAKIDPKFLKGLKFHGAEPKVVEKDGRKVNQNIPFERPLKEADVLDFKDAGDTVIIVTKDGRKYTVDKNAREEEKK